MTDRTLYVAYSGVEPAFRGRGLMKLIKQQAHVAAEVVGATVSKTSNEEHNLGIRRVKAKLGYTVTSGTYRLVQQT